MCTIFDDGGTNIFDIRDLFGIFVLFVRTNCVRGVFCFRNGKMDPMFPLFRTLYCSSTTVIFWCRSTWGYAVSSSKGTHCVHTHSTSHLFLLPSPPPLPSFPSKPKPSSPFFLAFCEKQEEKGGGRNNTHLLIPMPSRRLREGKGGECLSKRWRESYQDV